MPETASFGTNRFFERGRDKDRERERFPTLCMIPLVVGGNAVSAALFFRSYPLAAYVVLCCLRAVCHTVLVVFLFLFGDSSPTSSCCCAFIPAILFFFFVFGDQVWGGCLVGNAAHGAGSGEWARRR